MGGKKKTLREIYRKLIEAACGKEAPNIESSTSCVAS